MPHEYVFPYAENESGQVYVFSAAACLFTSAELDHAQSEGIITQAYCELLAANVYTSEDDAPHPAYWATI